MADFIDDEIRNQPRRRRNALIKKEQNYIQFNIKTENEFYSIRKLIATYLGDNMFTINKKPSKKNSQCKRPPIWHRNKILFYQRLCP